jgi:hypothetical protein
LGVGCWTIHFGKYNVEEQQVDLIAMLAEFRDGFFAIARSKNRIAQSSQRLAGEFAQALMVRCKPE